MEESFKLWRDSSRQLEDTEESIVISDESDVIENSFKGDRIIIEESDYDNSNASEYMTPKKNETFDDDDTPIVVKGQKSKKYRIIKSDDSTDDDTPIVVKGKKSKKYRIKSDDSTDDDDDDNDNDDSKDKYTTSETHDNFITSDSDENNSFSNKSYGSFFTPINKGKKRKDITHDNTREDIKELKINSDDESESESESFTNFDKQNDQNTMDENGRSAIVDDTKFHDEAVTIEIGSESSSGRNTPSELVSLIGREEASIGNFDPIAAQKRALTICKLEKLESEVAKSKLLLAEGSIEILPDGGKKLRENIREQEKEIEQLINELENNTLLTRNFDKEETESTDETGSLEERPYMHDERSNFRNDPNLDLNIPMDPIFPELEEQFLPRSKKEQETREKELALTEERLKDLHKSLVARPSEDEEVEDPRGLKVQLMPHQRHALAWLLWRERKKPSGGVLADDMGLGKTLTMISLIMITLADKNSDSEDEDEDSDEWNNGRPLHHKGGTLIVCPASLLIQWENEVRSKCKRGLLSVEVYHGNKRENVPKRLAQNDMVITTYHLLPREYRSNSTLYKINWRRVILDEAHIIRNPKSQLSQAACALVASKRWALTGTPIQNKELDLYSILKFLRCSPFDDIRVWKRWVDNKSAAGHQRLATVMKTLMLRRTKQELMAKGNLESLPSKSIEEVNVKLDPEEQLVYEKILVYSRTLFAQFLAQRAEKHHMYDLNSGRYDRPAFLSNPNKDTKFTEAQNKLLARHADVKTHEILVLLLRLRQVCCHPALIHAMLDQEDVQQSGIAGMENIDPELLSRVHRMSLNAIKDMDMDEENTDQRIAENLLTMKNPVFDADRISSKMKALLNMVKEILEKGDDKLIIVSQWASLIDIIASRLSSIKGARFSKFTGKVAVKDRQNVVDSFNDPNSKTRILLLSLTAGGVGLNLIGGNHLLLFDIHWNPQLESQAQDRIYRFGQKRDVYIYKFICTDTIEERIKALQERKLAIAQNVLSGDKNTAMKLTFNDLKSLFGF